MMAGWGGFAASRFKMRAAAALVLIAGMSACLISQKLPAPAVSGFAGVAPHAEAPSSPAPAPFYSAQLLASTTPSVHAATLAELDNGDIAAAWFGGAREGARDVSVWYSVLNSNSGAWSPDRSIVTRAMTTRATLAYVRKIGNPVLYFQNGTLHLWYVSVGFGGWAASSINHMTSTDHGASWSRPVKLKTSPFFNISTLVRAIPVSLQNGDILLPVYHEFIDKHGEVLRVSPAGQTLAKLRMPTDRKAIQPTIVPLSDRQALAFMRDSDHGPGRIQLAATDDAGASWQARAPLPISNPNSSVAAVLLPSGRILLAGNTEAGRRELTLWTSADQGATWQHAKTLERSPDDKDEYSYPAMLVTRDGRIHIVYTWLRKQIKYVVFNEAWLDERKQ